MKELKIVVTAGQFKRELNALNTDDLKYKLERDSNAIFYRWKLSGGLTFAGNDFHWLHKQSICTPIYLEISRWCNGEYKLLPKQLFSLTDAKYDLKRCELTIDKYEANDGYKCVLDFYEREFNILEVPPAAITVSAKLEFDAQFEFLRIQQGTLNEDTVRDADTWKSFLEGNYWIDGNLTTRGIRNPMQLIFRLVRREPYENGEIQDLSGDGWRVIEDGIIENGITYARYAKQPDLYNFQPYRYDQIAHFTRYPSLIQLLPGQSFDQSRYIEITGPGGAFNEETKPNLNIRTKVNENRPRRLIWEFGVFTFKRGRTLVDVLKYLIKKTCPSTLQENISDFLTTDINYATGSTNALKNVLLFAKSDIIGYNSTEVATKATTSLKKITDSLRKMLQIYWYLDANGKFRIEHYSFFNRAGEFDLTGNPFNNQAYSYDKPNMPQFQKLTFGNYFKDDFRQGVIEYTGECITKLEGQNTEEETVTDFDNDLYNLLTNGEALDRTGFTLVVHKDGKVVEETGDVSREVLVNGHVAAANLVKHYYQHGRVFLNGLVNSQPALFESVVPILKQDAIELASCCDAPTVDPFAKFITLLGREAELESAEIALKDFSVKFIVKHGVLDVTALVGREFDNSFDTSLG